MGDVTELSAIVIPTRVATISGHSLEYLGAVPRLGVGFSGKTLEEAKNNAAAMVKDNIERCNPDFPQHRFDATSLETMIGSANGKAIVLGSVEVKFNKHPPYIQSNEVRVTFYQFTQTDLANKD